MNPNADTLDGYHAGNGSGQIPISNGVLSTDLNADLLDGSHGTAFAPASHNHWGQSWTGSGTGLTLSGGTIGLSASGTGYGVYGRSDSATGSGVYGYSTAAGGNGVYGYSSATTGNSNAVHGQSDSASGRGVLGSNSAGGYGVYGTSTGTAVYGESFSGYGVHGKANAPSGAAVGVYGESASTAGIGIFGKATATSGATCGLVGRSDSPDGYGVYGYNLAASGPAYGVYGQSDSTAGYGGFFVSNSNTATAAKAGVYGLDFANSVGVAGDSSNGVGVGAWSENGDLIMASDGDFPVGSVRFYVDQAGNVHYDGATMPFAEVPAPNGAGVEHRSLYGMASPEAWFEDFGSAALKDGKATVRIDPLFAETVNLAIDYYVYLTPVCSDLILLGVTDKGPTSFTVQGATLDSKPSFCAFDYRIVAKQRGYEDRRLEKVNLPALLPSGTQEMPRQGIPVSD
jgi:hypothetical protein